MPTNAKLGLSSILHMHNASQKNRKPSISLQAAENPMRRALALQYEDANLKELSSEEKECSGCESNNKEDVVEKKIIFKKELRKSEEISRSIDISIDRIKSIRSKILNAGEFIVDGRVIQCSTSSLFCRLTNKNQCRRKVIEIVESKKRQKGFKNPKNNLM